MKGVARPIVIRAAVGAGPTSAVMLDGPPRATPRPRGGDDGATRARFLEDGTIRPGTGVTPARSPDVVCAVPLDAVAHRASAADLVRALPRDAVQRMIVDPGVPAALRVALQCLLSRKVAA
jgi:hypothetical protein